MGNGARSPRLLPQSARPVVVADRRWTKLWSVADFDDGADRGIYAKPPRRRPIYDAKDVVGMQAQQERIAEMEISDAACV